jgi:hypothetical protein
MFNFSFYEEEAVPDASNLSVAAVFPLLCMAM